MKTIDYECISYDKKYLCYKEEVFQCPRCFKTITVPVIRNYEINKQCKCEWPKYVNIMEFIKIQCPPGYEEIDNELQ